MRIYSLSVCIQQKENARDLNCTWCLQCLSQAFWIMIKNVDSRKRCFDGKLNKRQNSTLTHIMA